MTEQSINYNLPEPTPISNNSPSIHDLVVADLSERKQFGLQKYGTLLQANNGRTGLVDAYQEILDLSVYLRQCLEESKPVDTADPFTELVELKRQERDLADKIKLAQEKAIDAAMELGKVGQIAVVNGAKVAFKLVTVKPKSPMITALHEDITEMKMDLEVLHAKRLAELRAEIDSLLTSEVIEELEEKLQEETEKLVGEKKPQIAVTLPK
jgi:hypothetical protein